MKLSCLQIPIILHFASLLTACALLWISTQNCNYQVRWTKYFELNWPKQTHPPRHNCSLLTPEELGGKGQAEVPSTTSSGHTTHSSQPLRTEPSPLPGFLGAEVMNNLLKDNKPNVEYSYFLTAKSTSLSNTTSTLQQPSSRTRNAAPATTQLWRRTSKAGIFGEAVQPSSQETEESQQKGKWAAENC